MNAQQPKRVLHIVSAMDRGGAETLLMNVYRTIDRTKVQFDFVTHRSDRGHFDHEIEQMGGKIYTASSLGTIGPVGYINHLSKIMKSVPYQVVHSHTDYQSGLPAMAAKLAGIENRICHSHSTSWPFNKSLKSSFMLKGLQSIIHFSATQLCSCSHEAGAFLFGEKAVNNGEVSIVKNGINVDDYLNESTGRENVLQELNLRTDTKIIGHVGKFSKSKNQRFILKLMKRLLEKDKRYVALFVGDGPQMETVKEEAKQMGISEHLLFLGVRTDIPRLMKAFDVFVFPSLFEGFGIVTIEAQMSGTPCILSDSVPKSTDLGVGLTKYISLNENLKTWMNEIENGLKIEKPNNEKILHAIKQKGLSIQQNVDEWMKLYQIN